MSLLERLSRTSGPPALVLIRLMVGGVFLSEGIQKFLFADDVGVGRFARIGIPSPGLMAPFVGVVEIVCGTLILFGLLTRLAAIALLIDILVAIFSTKLPILFGHGYWRFSVSKVAYYGFWGMLHEARTDLSMFLGLLFLLIVGAGKWSIDSRLTSRRRSHIRVEA